MELFFSSQRTWKSQTIESNSYPAWDILLTMSKNTIKIYREFAIADLLRDYTVLVNNNVVGALKLQESLLFEVPNNSTIQLKIDWCYSNPITITNTTDAPAHYYIKAKSNITGWKRLLMLYYITLGRKKYITLSVFKMESEV